MKKILPLFIWWFSLSFLWGIFRLFPSTEMISELLAKPFIWIGITVLFLKLNIIPDDVIINLKNNYLTKKPFFKIFILPLVAITLYFFFLNFTQFSFPKFSFNLLLLSIFINFSTGAVEEFVYRGVMYVWLLKNTNEIIAFILVQVLFLLGHLPILILTSNSLTTALVRSFFIILLGSINTGIFRFNKSLYSSMLSHGMWNTLVHYLLLS